MRECQRPSNGARDCAKNEKGDRAAHSCPPDPLCLDQAVNGGRTDLPYNALASKAIIEASLAQATAQLATDFDEASYLRQQELIAQRAQMNTDLAQLLRHED